MKYIYKTITKTSIMLCLLFPIMAMAKVGMVKSVATFGVESGYQLQISNKLKYKVIRSDETLKGNSFWEYLSFKNKLNITKDDVKKTIYINTDGKSNFKHIEGGQEKVPAEKQSQSNAKEVLKQEEKKSASKTKPKESKNEVNLAYMYGVSATEAKNKAIQEDLKIQRKSLQKVENSIDKMSLELKNTKQDLIKSIATTLAKQSIDPQVAKNEIKQLNLILDEVNGFGTILLEVRRLIKEIKVNEPKQQFTSSDFAPITKSVDNLGLLIESLSGFMATGRMQTSNSIREIKEIKDLIRQSKEGTESKIDIRLLVEALDNISSLMVLISREYAGIVKENTNRIVTEVLKAKLDIVGMVNQGQKQNQARQADILNTIGSVRNAMHDVNKEVKGITEQMIERAYDEDDRATRNVDEIKSHFNDLQHDIVEEITRQTDIVVKETGTTKDSVMEVIETGSKRQSNKIDRLRNDIINLADIINNQSKKILKIEKENQLIKDNGARSEEAVKILLDRLFDIETASEIHVVDEYQSSTATRQISIHIENLRLKYAPIAGSWNIKNKDIIFVFDDNGLISVYGIKDSDEIRYIVGKWYHSEYKLFLMKEKQPKNKMMYRKMEIKYKVDSPKNLTVNNLIDNEKNRYANECSSCHESGFKGAPKTDDDVWERYAEDVGGLDLSNTLLMSGHYSSCKSCTESEISTLFRYIGEMERAR